MGFNTFVTIRNADLPMIALDPHFGKKVRDLVMGGDCCRRREEGERVSSVVALSQIAEAWRHAPSDYEVFAARSHHASGEEVHVVEAGVTHSFSSREPKETHMALASALTVHGYRSALKPAGLLWEAAAAPVADEGGWCHDFSEDAFNGGVTSFIVLNDMLHELGDNKRLGAALLPSLEKWWAAEERLCRSIREKGSAKDAWSNHDGIATAGQSISIIAVTPADRTDILITGGNWGRALRPHLSHDELIARDGKDASRAKMYEGFRSSSLTAAKAELLGAGFHVRLPDRTRSESPLLWRKKDWLTEDHFRVEEGPQP